MFKIKKKRVISSLLSVALVFGLLGSSVVSTSAATSVTSSGGIGTSKVATTIEPSIFSATVPYVLPISIDADQNVYTADNVVISNNSNGPIKVSDATLTTNEGWELVADGTDFSSVLVNSKQFTMTVLNSPVLTSGSINTDSFGTIDGNSSLNITYDADAAVQGEEVSDINIANILFTIEWNNVEITSATVSKTALQSFAKTVTTFQKTSERLNIDDVKETDGVTKIDDGATDKSIYAWSDSDGNGYWWTNAMVAYLPDDCSELFYNCTNLKSLDLSSLESNNVVTMNKMFYNCSNLISLNVSSLDTINVSDMSNMFGGMGGSCSSLTALDLSSFDTSNVVYMSYMFYGCSSLSILNLSSFDTKNVEDTAHMFYGCSNLNILDLSSFDSNSIDKTWLMFANCEKLSTIYVSNFDLSNVATSKSYTMFDGCINLVGGNGTRYNSLFTDKTYARIDTADTPGYFTYKAKAA